MGGGWGGSAGQKRERHSYGSLSSPGSVAHEPCWRAKVVADDILCQRRKLHGVAHLAAAAAAVVAVAALEAAAEGDFVYYYGGFAGPFEFVTRRHSF